MPLTNSQRRKFKLAKQLVYNAYTKGSERFKKNMTVLCICFPYFNDSNEMFQPISKFKPTKKNWSECLFRVKDYVDSDPISSEDKLIMIEELIRFHDALAPILNQDIIFTNEKNDETIIHFEFLLYEAKKFDETHNNHYIEFAFAKSFLEYDPHGFDLSNKYSSKRFKNGINHLNRSYIIVQENMNEYWCKNIKKYMIQILLKAHKIKLCYFRKNDLNSKNIHVMNAYWEVVPILFENWYGLKLTTLNERFSLFQKLWRSKKYIPIMSSCQLCAKNAIIHCNNRCGVAYCSQECKNTHQPFHHCGCTICNKPALYKCTCGTVYCSKKCQTFHWKNKHKYACIDRKGLNCLSTIQQQF